MIYIYDLPFYRQEMATREGYRRVMRLAVTHCKLSGRGVRDDGSLMAITAPWALLMEQDSAMALRFFFRTWFTLSQPPDTFPKPWKYCWIMKSTGLICLVVCVTESPMPCTTLRGTAIIPGDNTIEFSWMGLSVSKDRPIKDDWYLETLVPRSTRNRWDRS